MTERLDIIAVGDRLAVLLSADLAARIGATAGGQIEAEADAVSVRLLGQDRELTVWLTAARRVMDEDAEALAVLAR